MFPHRSHVQFYAYVHTYVIYDDVTGHTINQSPFGRSVGQSVDRSVSRSVGRLAGQRPYTGRFSTKCTVHITTPSNACTYVLITTPSNACTYSSPHLPMHVHTHHHTFQCMYVLITTPPNACHHHTFQCMYVPIITPSNACTYSSPHLPMHVHTYHPQEQMTSHHFLHPCLQLEMLWGTSWEKLYNQHTYVHILLPLYSNICTILPLYISLFTMIPLCTYVCT